MNSSNSSWIEGVKTIVCFGDSITARPDGYVKILSDKLAPRGIVVINAGRGGDKTPWALTRLESDVIARKPDAVSVFLGTNDSAIGRGPWVHEPRVPPEAYKTNLIWIIYLCRKAGIGKFSVTPPLWRFEGEAWATYGDIMAPYRIAAREAAEEAKACLVPADIAFAEEWARHSGHTGLLLTADGVHLTEKGNEILADAMLKSWNTGALMS